EKRQGAQKRGERELVHALHQMQRSRQSGPGRFHAENPRNSSPRRATVSGRSDTDTPSQRPDILIFGLFMNAAPGTSAALRPLMKTITAVFFSLFLLPTSMLLGGCVAPGVDESDAPDENVGTVSSAYDWNSRFNDCMESGLG